MLTLLLVCRMILSIFAALQVTTGASNDLQQVASIAKRMVTQWGMSDKVGQLVIGSNQGGALHCVTLLCYQQYKFAYFSSFW
jgi:ATP-dependent Zn protease